MNFDQRNYSAYYIEMGGAFLLYRILILIAKYIFSLGIPYALQIPVALIPMLAFAGGIWAVVRLIKRVDEMQRQCIKRDLAVAFGISAFITFSFGFLEFVGLPRLSWFWVWWVMGFSWLFVSLYYRSRGK